MEEKKNLPVKCEREEDREVGGGGGRLNQHSDESYIT